jgi:hypothetical protein
MRHVGALLLLCSTLAATGAHANDTAELQRQIEAQNELIRKQSEALEHQTQELQQMGDRVRVLEDERAAGVVVPSEASVSSASEEKKPHRAGSGFPVAETDWGSLAIRFYTSVRYLNQRGLESTTTDAFGNERTPKRRNDIQHQKVLLYFSGWALDPSFTYLLYAWTSNPSQGLGAQVVLAGNLNYKWNEHLQLGIGTNSLPGVRSTAGNFPFWLSVDNRMIADEFFRPSYTFGVWAKGDILEQLSYQVMLGNNISQLGVDANRLDADLDTVAAELAWAPLGDYPGAFGDFAEQETPKLRLGLHFSFSQEDVQNQPDTDDGFQNVTLRLSDGNPIFTQDLFGAGIQIRNANYQMASFDAGIKYKGFSIEGEYYYRLLNELSGRQMADLGFDSLEDHGFQLQASAMLLPETLQGYLSGSRVFGEYGNPWDARIGLNWFPFRTRALRWNNEVMYVDDSPVGGSSLAQPVGGEGPVFYSSVEFFF